MAYVDVKYTIWERLVFESDTDINDVIEEYKTHGYFTHNINYTELLWDTQEDMSLKENQGNPTMEFYDDNDELIFKNGNKE